MQVLVPAADVKKLKEAMSANKLELQEIREAMATVYPSYTSILGDT